MKPTIWISKNKKNLMEATNNRGLIVAIHNNLETLEDSLDLIYQGDWVGYVG